MYHTTMRLFCGRHLSFLPPLFSESLHPSQKLFGHGRESLSGDLANGGFRYLSTVVHDCLKLSLSTIA